MHVWRMNARWVLDRKTNVRHSLHRLTLRSLTEPASSMVNPACIKNTSNAVLLTDCAKTTVEDMAMRACARNFNQFCSPQMAVSFVTSENHIVIYSMLYTALQPRWASVACPLSRSGCRVLL